MKEKIKELERMVEQNHPATMERLTEVVAQATDPRDKELLASLAARLMSDAARGMDRVEDALHEQILRDELGPLSEALNMSYIARTYFGKSRSWLCQRVNGHRVNGRRVTLSDDERITLNNALQDIQGKISAFTCTA